jgi:putative membrane protein
MLKHPSAGLLRRYAALAGAGVVLIGCAALDELGRLLISAHMLQHLLLSVAAPVLVVLARPRALVGRLVPLPVRRGLHHALRASAAAAVARFARHPLVAWIAFAGAFIVWHLPAAYQWSLEDGRAHALSASTFFLAGIAFWRAVLAPAALRRLGHGLALLMVVSAAVIGSLPGALMTFAPRLLYATGVDTVAICGLRPIEDQALGGVLMWVGMDAVFFAIAGWLFVAWMREAERSVTLRMAARAGLPLLAGVLAPLLLAQCGEQAAGSTGGPDPRKGVALIDKYGCGQCHLIPGVDRADGVVGPPLTGIARRVYIAGVLRNSPDNMTEWIQHPQAIVPGNVMPDMGVSHDEARDIAAYLDTLR